VASVSENAAIVKSRPQPAREGMMDSKCHPTAEACLSPEGQVGEMALAHFPGIIAAAAGQGA